MECSRTQKGQGSAIGRWLYRIETVGEVSFCRSGPTQSCSARHDVDFRKLQMSAISLIPLFHGYSINIEHLSGVKSYVSTLTNVLTETCIQYHGRLKY